MWVINTFSLVKSAFTKKKERLAERGGFESLPKPNKDGGETFPCHSFLHSRPALSRVVQSWDGLPDAIKTAILSLVDSTIGGAE